MLSIFQTPASNSLGLGVQPVNKTAEKSAAVIQAAEKKDFIF
jgi:hypothetical protein